MIKRTEPMSVGDIMRRVIEEAGLTAGLLEARAVAAWPQTVGSQIAARCSRPVMHKGVMHVAVASPALRSELSMCRSSIISSINSLLPSAVVDDIRFHSSLPQTLQH